MSNYNFIGSFIEDSRELIKSERGQNLYNITTGFINKSYNLVITSGDRTNQIEVFQIKYLYEYFDLLHYHEFLGRNNSHILFTITVVRTDIHSGQTVPKTISN